MPDSNAIAELVDRLTRIAHAFQFAEGLNPAQWNTLRFFARANKYSCSPSALAEYLHTTKGTASQTLNALEAKGYVQRTRCSEDRRSVTIVVTDKGREILMRDPLCRIARASESLPAVERDSAALAINRILSTLQREDNVASFGYCGRCAHYRCDGESSDGQHRCANSGESLPEGQLSRICIDFLPTA